MLNKVLQILWPSFIAAAAAELLFFAMFDPDELNVFGRALGLPRVAAYSIGFFIFWALTAWSSAMTWMLLRGRPLKGDEDATDEDAEGSRA